MKTKVKDFVFRARKEITAQPEAYLASSITCATGFALTASSSVFLTKAVFTKTATGVVVTLSKASLLAKVAVIGAGVLLTGYAGYAVWQAFSK